MAPDESASGYSWPCVIIFPYSVDQNSWFPSKQQNTAKVVKCHLWENRLLGHCILWCFLLPSYCLAHSLCRRTVAIFWDAQWSIPHGEELVSPSNSHGDLQCSNSCESTFGNGYLPSRILRWLKPLSVTWHQPRERRCVSDSQMRNAWIPDSQKTWGSRCLLF